MNWQEIEKKVLCKLAAPLAEAIRAAVPLHHGTPEEIRLRTGRPLALTLSGKNVQLEQLCTEEDMVRTVQLLCDHSLYSHIETLREGYICTQDGIRVGVCGRAVVENSKIIMLRDFTSLCIRLPHRYPNAGDVIYKVLMENHFQDSVLVFAPPGKGKTTVLRELAARLANPPDTRRVAVVDTRFELTAGLEDAMMLDVLAGHPRNTGMEIALRTMAPEYIICDEIASAEDRNALLHCADSGVRICASVHAGSLEELKRHPLIRDTAHIFSWYYGIDSEHNGTLFHAGKEECFV